MIVAVPMRDMSAVSLIPIAPLDRAISLCTPGPTRRTVRWAMRAHPPFASMFEFVEIAV